MNSELKGRRGLLSRNVLVIWLERLGDKNEKEFWTVARLDGNSNPEPPDYKFQAIPHNPTFQVFEYPDVSITVQFY
jgi:hypothetical protein